MSTCEECGAALGADRPLATKCAKNTPCRRARNRAASHKYRAAHPQHTRAYDLAHQAETRAHKRAGRLVAGGGNRTDGGGHISAPLAVAAWQAAQRAVADRAIARNRGATMTARRLCEGAARHARTNVSCRRFRRVTP